MLLVKMNWEMKYCEVIKIYNLSLPKKSVQIHMTCLFYIDWN